MLNYKGYIGHVTFDDENEIFHGEIINTRDVITFQSTTAHNLKQEFVESVDDYLECCNEREEIPDKPFSGKFNLRLSPELHKQVYIKATLEGKSLNSWVYDKLENAIREIN